MCGVLGQIVLNSDLPYFNVGEFENALNLQVHRGPDGFGVYEGEGFLSGHRRLSIIDVDHHSDQPMISSCGNYVLIFNGEIYNYLQLKDKLIEKGYVFQTASDTEVLLNSFIEYGVKCVQQFIGMFSFAIFDKTSDEFYIVRDRLGVKPLYFSKTDNSLIFSSEIKSILALDSGPMQRPLNKSAVSSYMSFRYPILNDTFFEGINSLAPGHYIKINKSSFEIIEYWNLIDCFLEQKDDKGEEYYIQNLRKILQSAVQYRMISDVPLGAFLSGGVDSSVITGIMADSSLEPVKTFSIGFEEEGYNEFEYANIIASKFKTDHHEIIMSGADYVGTLDSLISYKDAPLSVPNEVPLFLMCQELKKEITVVLSGEGADEIFGGYGRIFRSPYDYERVASIDNMDISDEEKRKFCENIFKKYSQGDFDNELDHFMLIYSYTSFSDKKELLNESIHLDDIETQLYTKFMGYFDELGEESYTNKMMYAFEKIHLVGLLHRLDTTSMAASVEARVPFVDHRLVEFAFKIPLKYKLKWNDTNSIPYTLTSDEISETYDTPKYILKKSYEGIIPKKVLYRKKMGFPVPLNNWFGGDFSDYAKKILLSKQATQRNVFNSSNVKDWLESTNLGDDHRFAMKIWMLVNLEIFFTKYFD